MIKAYLSKYTEQDHPVVTLLDKYVSKNKNFWMSFHRSESDNVCLVFINGEQKDFDLINTELSMYDLGIVDLDQSMISSAVTINASVLQSHNIKVKDIQGAATNEDLLNKLLQKLVPGHCPLAFNGTPKKKGTFTDNFTGTNDQLLQNRSGWTLVTDGAGRALIESNGLQFDEAGGGAGLSAWTCTDQGSANHYVEIKLIRVEARGAIYLCARLVDEDNFISFHLAGTGGAGARLCKMVAGALTDSIVTFQGVVDDVIKVECDGNTIKIYANDVQQGGDQTIADHNTETSEGFTNSTTTSGNAFFDDFEAGPMAAGGLSIPVVMNHIMQARNN